MSDEIIRKMTLKYQQITCGFGEDDDIEPEEGDMYAMRAALMVLADNVSLGMEMAALKEHHTPPSNLKSMIAAAIREAAK